MQKLRTISAVISLVLLLAGSGGCAGRPLVEGVDPKGRSLVLLLDSSGSMSETDPSRAAFTGASLACALAGQHDNVGVIAFNNRARVIVPLRPNGLAPARESLRAALGEVGRQGSTDFGIALEAAFTMLDAGKARPGSSAILLTDGLPTGRVNRFSGEFSRGSQDSALAIPDSVQRFAQRGWRIFAIVFGPEAPLTRTYLTQLVGPTGGAILEAKDSAGLLPAFEAVSVQALGYITAEQLSGEIVVPPDSRRLAVLSLFDKGDGELGALSCEGKPLEADKVIRFPAGRAAFGCELVEDPTPGSYRLELPEGASGLTLLEPAWYLELESGAPPAEVASGSRVPVRARVRSGSASGEGSNEAAFARIRDRLQCELEIKRAGRVLATIPIARASGSATSADVRFEGAFLAPAEAEPITVTVSAKIVEGGHTFASQRSVAVNVKGGGPRVTPVVVERVAAPEIGVPSRLDLAGFAGEELGTSFTVDGDAKSAVVCELQAPSGFTLTPSRLELAAGGHGSVALRAGGATRSGGSVAILARSTTAGVEPARREITVSLERGSLGASSVDLGTVSPGEVAEGVLEAPGCTVATPALMGPGGVSLALAWSGTKLVAKTAADSAPGAYAGRVEARCGGSTRTANVTLVISSPTPSQLDLTGSWGWTSTSFDLPAAGAVFELEPLVLDGNEGRIDPDLDVRTIDKGHGHYELRIFAPVTLPAGRYTAVFKATCGTQERVLPVRFLVTR